MGWYRIDTLGIFAGPSNPAVTAFGALWNSQEWPQSALMFGLRTNATAATYFVYWPIATPPALIEELHGKPCDTPLASNLELIYG